MLKLSRHYSLPAWEDFFLENDSILSGQINIMPDPIADEPVKSESLQKPQRPSIILSSPKSFLPEMITPTSIPTGHEWKRNGFMEKIPSFTPTNNMGDIVFQLPDLPKNLSIFDQVQTPQNLRPTVRTPTFSFSAETFEMLNLLLTTPQHGERTFTLPTLKAATPPQNLSPLPLTPNLMCKPAFKASALCSQEGCNNQVRSRGRCKQHGGSPLCSFPECTKSSQQGRFCVGHGGGKRCQENGCSKAAQSHGLCKAHGGGSRCKVEGCQKASQGRGFCRTHGGGKRCEMEGCSKGAQRGNFCAQHGGNKTCRFDGCKRTDRGGGYCETHREGQLCSVMGCKKLHKRIGLCSTHLREEEAKKKA